ncbi:MAG: hypothetical protein GKS00_02430 [Alphaproteobacteria bacterium]|nr:hypothetical protein [Alphaproteobacteria bacterium]
MSTDLPQQTVSYTSHVIDTARWDRFAPRDDDIFICTPPKCGTTWTQAICALLIFGHADSDVKPGVISPWLDAKHQPMDEMLAMLEAQTHRRFIKTHTPLDGIPYYPQCIYLAVYRDPRDVHFSMRNHATNQANGVNAHRATKDIGEGFRQWVQRPYAAGDEDNFSLAALVHHYETFKRFEHLPNVELMHFADMKHDLGAMMALIGDFLDIVHPAETMDALTEAAGFENMKKNASQFVPGAGQGRWKDEGRFFNKGSGNQWDGVLSAEDLALYDTRVRDLLASADVAWLEDGGLS